jgi:hypothetical protein
VPGLTQPKPAAELLADAVEGLRSDLRAQSARLERVLLVTGLLAFRGDTLSADTALRWVTEFLSKLETNDRKGTDSWRRRLGDC